MTDLMTKAGNENLNSWRNTINEVFALFEVNYHNQFYSAFKNDEDQLIQVKILWRDALKKFSQKQVLRAAKSIIEQSEYLPTLNRMLMQCAQESSSAPSAHQAYVEACRAASPKAEQAWSHPAVYEAGKRSDWFFLSTTAEKFAFPVFKNHYQDLLQQLNEGASIEKPALPDARQVEESEKTSKEEGLKKIKDLKKSLDF